MKLTTAAKYTAIGAVAGIAAYASYSHMKDLALTHGQTPAVAALLPVSVDGMLIVATIVMREDRQAGHKVRVWAWVAFVLGVAASVVANVLAAQSDITSRVISAWPAVALLLVIEVLATGKKSVERPADVEPLGSTDHTATVPTAVITEPSTVVVERPAEVEAPAPAKRAPRKAAVATVPAKPVKPAKTTARRPAEVTRKLATQALSAVPDTTRQDVAAQLDISDRQLRRVLNGPSGEQAAIDGQMPGQLTLVS